MRRGFKLARVPALIAAVAGAAALAGCGGSSDTSSTAAASSGGGGSSTQLALVGYSTPKKAYDALTGAFAQTTAGKGVNLASPSARRALRAARSIQASPPM